MTAAVLTIFSAKRSQAKRLSLDQGKLRKQPPLDRNPTAYRVAHFTGADELAAMLAGMTQQECLSNSVPRSGAPPEGSIKLKANAMGEQMARTKDCFRFGEAPGLLILDYDPHGPAMPQAQLWEAVTAICPQAKHAPAVAWYSASSYIYEGTKELAGAAGQRLYIVVSSATDIPRALQVLNARLALKGHGLHASVNAAGSVYIRHLFDKAMGEPARLDYAPAGADCTDGLESRRPAPVVLADGQPLDTRVYLPDLDKAEKKALAKLEKEAAQAVEAEAARVNAAWLEAQGEAAKADALAEGKSKDEADAAKDEAIDTARAMASGTLSGSVQITVENEAGAQVITVSDILREPKKWHGTPCLDPINPAHRGGAFDAMIYSDQPHPKIYSLDDGGRVYHLLQARAVLTLGPGRVETVARVIAHQLARSGALYRLGDRVCLAPGHAMDAKARADYVNGFRAITASHIAPLSVPHFAFQRFDKQGERRAADLDQSYVQAAYTRLAELAPVVSLQAAHPLLTPDGEVIMHPGFNEATGVYLHFDGEAFTAAMKRAEGQTLGQLLRTADTPFALYRWASPHDKAAVVATQFAIPLRPLLPIAPGLMVDAALQASGKTKVCLAIGALVLGQMPAVEEPPPDETEADKRVLCAVREAQPVVIFDNVMGTFKSPSISRAMTAGRYAGRLLQVSETHSGLFRPTMLASSNNASLDRDFQTRWLIARTTPGTDTPHESVFPYLPEDQALANRLDILAAIITIWQRFHAAGAPKGDGRGVRFGEWAKVRDLVLWLAAQPEAIEAIGPLGDPAESILNGVGRADPEEEAWGEVLTSLHDLHGFDPFQSPPTADLINLGTTYTQGADVPEARLARAYRSVTGAVITKDKPLSSVSLGKVLNHRVDRAAAGLRLKSWEGLKKVTQYAVIRA